MRLDRNPHAGMNTCAWWPFFRLALIQEFHVQNGSQRPRDLSRLGGWALVGVRWAAAFALLIAARLAFSAAPCPVCTPAIRHFDAADGLSHNAVIAVAQDTEGFVWLGTRDGLDRLDGVHVERFARIAGEDLRAERLVALAADTRGGVWIALRETLLYHAASGRQHRIALASDSALPNLELTTLLADGEGVWAGGESGLWWVAHPAAAAHEIPLADRRPIRALQRNGDHLAMLSGDSSCRLQYLSVDDLEVRDEHPAPCVTALRWVDDGLWLDARRTWRPGQPIPDPLVSATDLPLPYAILPWRGGLVFAALKDTRWRAPDGTEHPLWQRNNLFGEILAALVDQEDGLWLGGYAGAWRLDPDAPAFVGLDGGELDRQLSEHAASDIARFDGRWWFASFGHGLLAWDEGSRSRRTWSGGDPASPWQQHCGDFLWDLRPLDEVLLINGQCLLHGDGQVIPVSAQTTLDAGRDSLLDAQGRLWVAGTTGLSELVAARRMHRLDGAFETLAEAPNGTLWLAPAFGTHRPPEARLTGYDTVSGAVRHIALPEGTRVYDMLADGTTLWLATGLGLLRVDSRNAEVRNFTPSQGEAGRVLYSVRRDGHGALWIGSNRGLLRFDPNAVDGRRFRHFDARDGLGISEFNRRSHAVDEQGRLLFGGIGGVVRFDPSRAQASTPAPRPRVTRASVWNREGERSLAPDGDRRLVLAADDLTVALDFAAPGFRRAGHMRFRYRLDGVDATWVEDAGARSARYPRLAPGDYRFRLQAGSGEAGWREAEAPLLLRFRPAWHESTWFRVPAVLGVLLAAWLLYRWRLARLLEMERLRTRIAADLHDEMGSELAAIGMSASMLGQRADLGAGERRRLAGVAESAQKVAESLRDIVWYVNPDKDNVTALGERLQTLARRLFGEDGVVVLNGWRGDDAGLPMAVRRELHLICREALTNAHRHAEADRVELRLDRDAQGLCIEIADNGRGFDTRTGGDGNGLGNMARRAAAIGAVLDVDSAPGRGTRVRIRLAKV